MGWIHFILAVILVVPYFLFGFIYNIYILAVSGGSAVRRRQLSFSFLRPLCRALLFICGIRVTVIGIEKVPKDRAVLFICNHRSMFDAVVAIANYPQVFSPVSKDSLQKVPVLAWWMKKIDALFLDRDNIEKGVQMVNDAVALLKEGQSVLIFPEGTRNKEEGTLLPFKGGSFKIAIKAGAPVVPVTCVNTGEIFEGHIPQICSRHVILEFSDPIETKGMSVPERKVLPVRVRDEILKCYEKDAKLI